MQVENAALMQNMLNKNICEKSNNVAYDHDFVNTKSVVKICKRNLKKLTIKNKNDV